MALLLRRTLILFPIAFLAIAFFGLLANPSDFVFPFSFWDEGRRVLIRFSHAWIAIGTILILHKLHFLDQIFNWIENLNEKRFVLMTLALSVLLRILWSFIT